MPLDLSESSVFTTPVTVPEDGDDRDAASVLTAFQALTDRTRNLKTVLDGFDAADHDFTGAVTLDGTTVVNGDLFIHGAISSDLYAISLYAPTAYWRSLPTYTAAIEGNGGAPPYVQRTPAAVLFSGTAGANAYLYGEIELPHGTSFDAIRLGYHATADHDTLIKVYKYTLNTGTGNGVSAQLGSTLTVPAGSALGVYTVSFAAETVDNSGVRYTFSIDCGDQVSGSKATLQWAQAQTTDHFISNR